MWIFLSDAMVSIVADRGNSRHFMVRARFEGDIERAFGDDITVIEMDVSDYRYRASLPRKRVQKVISRKLGMIDYDNFKNSVPVDDHARHRVYMDVWSVLERAQNALHPKNWASLFGRFYEPRQLRLVKFDYNRYDGLTAFTRWDRFGIGVDDSLDEAFGGDASLSRPSALLEEELPL